MFGGVASPNLDYPQTINTITEDILININEAIYSLSLNDIELCGNDTYGRDYLYKKAGKWYKHCIWNKAVITEEANISLNNTTDEYTEFQILDVLSPQSANSYLYPVSNMFSNKVDNRCVSIANYILCRVPSAVGISTVEEFKELLSENNLVVYYILAEELDEEIKDETLKKQLNKLNKVELKKGTNAISTSCENLNPNIELTYIVDLKTYIDNKILELTT